MTQELKTFEEIIAAIENGTYKEGLTDQLFLKECESLKENAEIFNALNPSGAAQHFKQGRLNLYSLLTRKNTNGFKPNRQQQEQLAFVERGLLQLYRFYTELCAYVND